MNCDMRVVVEQNELILCGEIGRRFPRKELANR